MRLIGKAAAVRDVDQRRAAAREVHRGRQADVLQEAVRREVDLLVSECRQT